METGEDVLLTSSGCDSGTRFPAHPSSADSGHRPVLVGWRDERELSVDEDFLWHPGITTAPLDRFSNTCCDGTSEQRRDRVTDLPIHAGAVTCEAEVVGEALNASSFALRK